MEIPEIKGEKFLTLMVWVALFGAALMLAIDYSLKRSLLQLSDKAHTYYWASMGNPAAQRKVNEYEPIPAEQGRHDSTDNSLVSVHSHSSGNSESGDHTGLAVDSVEKSVPYEVYQAVRLRDSNGRFSRDTPADSE